MTNNNKISGAEAVIKTLLEEGVDLIYGYPGGAIMPIYDELYKYQDKLNHVLTRHEQGATHAAQGFSRVSGKVGVVMATSGPGATNLVTGIADAQIDSTPMVCITGQVASHLLGSDAFQETDIIGISTPVTKWNCQITKAKDIPEILAKAFYIAKSGRPGPVLIDITKDAQFELMHYQYKKCISVRSYKPIPDYSIDQIKKASQLINESKKPFIVFGQGVILGEAENEFKEFIEKTGIPSAWTILGLSALPTDHYLNVGMVGMHGNYGPNVLTNECDLLIAIGMRFDDRVTGNLETYAKQAKIIHMEIDPAEVNKNVECDIAVWGCGAVDEGQDVDGVDLEVTRACGQGVLGGTATGARVCIARGKDGLVAFAHDHGRSQRSIGREVEAAWWTHQCGVNESRDEQEHRCRCERGRDPLVSEPRAKLAGCDLLWLERADECFAHGSRARGPANECVRVSNFRVVVRSCVRSEESQPADDVELGT